MISTEESPSSAPDFSTSTRYMVCIGESAHYEKTNRIHYSIIGTWKIKYQYITWKKTEMKAMLYPKRSKEKSPRAAMRTPAAVNMTERVT